MAHDKISGEDDLWERFHCRVCGKHLKSKPNTHAKSGKCPRCGALMSSSLAATPAHSFFPGVPAASTDSSRILRKSCLPTGPSNRSLSTISETEAETVAPPPLASHSSVRDDTTNGKDELIDQISVAFEMPLQASTSGIGVDGAGRPLLKRIRTYSAHRAQGQTPAISHEIGQAAQSDNPTPMYALSVNAYRVMSRYIVCGVMSFIAFALLVWIVLPANKGTLGPPIAREDLLRIGAQLNPDQARSGQVGWAPFPNVRR